MNKLEREVTANVICDKLFAIDNFHVRAICILQWLIHIHVLLATLSEVLNRLLWVNAFVVGGGQLHRLDVRLQYFFVVADRLYKYLLRPYSCLAQSIYEPLPPLPRRVRGVVHAHPHPVLLHVFDQVVQRGVAGNVPLRHGVGIAVVVERRGHLRPDELPTVIAHVENLGRDVVEEGQVAADALGDVGLARGGQPHHYDDQLVALRDGGPDYLQGRRILTLRVDVRHRVVDLITRAGAGDIIVGGWHGWILNRVSLREAIWATDARIQVRGVDTQCQESTRSIPVVNLCRRRRL
mmetsp:Transcript_36078/g.107909  ORF Transcript_36078/g.107909 Transcript_36078/m.107909 type:complete len:294 (-) Transcript_36078:119-1000(-)